MKMKKEHYEILRKGIFSIFDDPQYDINEHKEVIANDPRVKNRDIRFRWDLLNFWARKPMVIHDFICGTLYDYLHDEHIDTALKNIIKERY